MADNAHAGVARQNAFEAFGCLRRAIGNDHLSGMLAVANATPPP